MEIEKTVPTARRGGIDAEDIKNAAVRKKISEKKEIDVYKTARRYVMRGEFSPQWKNNRGRGKLTVVFLVDSSGSMASGKQMANVKAIIGETVGENKGKITEFAGVALSRDGARIFSPAGTDTGKLLLNLAELKTGGRTNMSAGVALAGKILRKAKNKKSASAAVYVFTDGRINFCENGGDPFENSVRKFKTVIGKLAETTVVDTEAGFVKIGAAVKLSEAVGAKHIKAGEMRRE